MSLSIKSQDGVDMIPALTFAAGILVSIFRDNDQPPPARVVAFLAAFFCFAASVGLFVAGRA
jgi:hypothetical protein